MRKYLVGILIGAAIMFTSSVFANDIKTLVGVAVQGEFPVKINGETLDKPAIVINGTSYLPNRAIADALGMDISFDADLGITLSDEEISTVTTSESSVTEATYLPRVIDSKIRIISNSIWMLNANIQTGEDSPDLGSWKSQLVELQDELAIWEARKAAIPQ